MATKRTAEDTVDREGGASPVLSGGAPFSLSAHRAGPHSTVGDKTAEEPSAKRRRVASPEQPEGAVSGDSAEVESAVVKTEARKGSPGDQGPRRSPTGTQTRASRHTHPSPRAMVETDTSPPGRDEDEGKSGAESDDAVAAQAKESKRAAAKEPTKSPPGTSPDPRPKASRDAPLG